MGLPHVVIFGFVRVGTNARAFQHPFTPAAAAQHVRTWQKQPVVSIVESGSDTGDRVLDSLESLGTAGNLVTDAQIAAIAIEHDAVVHTADADFVRFPRLRWLNPLTGVGSRNLRREPPP